ncbi:tigger transposable element-derived protein 6-like [Stomoxys calcitrans]|uniref:tigger transposable element-derived protein 6-like n=1 Tax=Stomoxys calcitrans TaxID=35570 RepID=UPI0027E37528|nr:tigger transposable element-derived protein 6-like [Stomoxys calcitrans]
MKKKLEIIEKIKAGVPRKIIYEQFDCSAATVCSISSIATKNKNILLKRIRGGSNKQVEEALHLWFINMRSKEATISGPIIMQKAKDLANIMNIDFVPTIGWLERWKKRENIHFKKLHGEKNSANTVAASEWIKNILPELLKNYSEDDIYNADETALLYKPLPGGSLANRSDQPSGSKISKYRITLLFITNSSRSDKYVFSVGKSLKERTCL